MIRYLLDTNAIISINKGNETLLNLINNADFVGFSIISVVEFLSYSNLSSRDKEVFQEMSDEAIIINLDMKDAPLINAISDVRKRHRIKLLDAIIAATALVHNCDILSNDKAFQKISELKVINF